MNTILQMVKEKRSGESGRQMKNIRICSPLPGFLIPPDEAAAMRGKLQILMEIVGSR